MTNAEELSKSLIIIFELSFTFTKLVSAKLNIFEKITAPTHSQVLNKK